MVGRIFGCMHAMQPSPHLVLFSPINISEWIAFNWFWATTLQDRRPRNKTSVAEHASVSVHSFSPMVWVRKINCTFNWPMTTTVVVGGLVFHLYNCKRVLMPSISDHLVDADGVGWDCPLTRWTVVLGMYQFLR